MNALRVVFGEGEALGPLQMGARAAVMFAVAIALVRLSGMRSFGGKSAFDRTVEIMLGAVLARGVVGASPFGSAVVAGAVVVVVHRLIALLCWFVPRLEPLVKGQQRELYRDGVFHEAAMLRSGVTRHDLLEGVRSSAHVDSLEAVAAAYIERSGEISAVARPLRPGRRLRVRARGRRA